MLTYLHFFFFRPETFCLFAGRHTLWRVPTSLSSRDSNTHERQLTGKIRANLYTLQPSFISLSSTSECSHLCPGRKGRKEKSKSEEKKGGYLNKGSNRGTTNKAAWEIFFLALTCAATDIEQVERERRGGDGEKRERDRQKTGRWEDREREREKEKMCYAIRLRFLKNHFCCRFSSLVLFSPLGSAASRSNYGG